MALTVEDTTKPLNKIREASSSSPAARLIVRRDRQQDHLILPIVSITMVDETSKSLQYIGVKIFGEYCAE